MKDIDFEAKRREIDLEMQRQDNERRKKREIEQRSQHEKDEADKREKKKKEEARSTKGTETEKVSRAEIVQNVGKDDLRVVLEESRNYSNLTPPPVPPPVSNRVIPTTSSGVITSNSSAYVPSSFAPISVSTILPDVTHKIPGFDYSRLGDDPNTAGSNGGGQTISKETENNDSLSDRGREARIKNFTEDCDTVAFVTQMLISEDPSLENPLMTAMKKVLQKVMQKHLEVLPKA